MASINDENDAEERARTSVLDIQRFNLLDMVEDRNRNLNKKNILHRMFFVSHIRNEAVNRTSIGNHYEKLFKAITSSGHGEQVTGLMLIYMRHIISVVESSSDMLVALSKDMCDQEQRDDSFIDQSKILIVSHDIPLRLFNAWNFRVLDIEATKIEAYEPPSTSARLILDVVTQLLKLGDHLGKQPKLSAKLILDSLHEKVPDLLPQQGAIYYLLNEDIGCTLQPNEYMKMHVNPFDITLEEELTWPIPTRLFPYN